MRKIQASIFVYIVISAISTFIGFQSQAQNAVIDSLLQILPTQKGTDRAKTLIELCVELHFTNADSAKLFGREALKMANELQSIELEVDALHNLGVANEAQGNYEEALKLELRALEIRKQIGDELKTANTLNNIGIIYDEQGDYQRALSYYYDARRIYERLNDKGKIAMVLTNIGIVLKAQGEYRKVVGYYQQAMKIYHDLGKKFGEAACHANLGAVYFNLAMYDSAIYYSLMAEKEFTEQNNQQFLPTTLVNTGIAFAKLGQTEKAKSYLLRAKQLDESFDNKKDLAIVNTHLAGIYQNEGDFAKAHAAAATALDIATKINAQQEILEARLALSGIYVSQKNFAAAYQEYKKYVAVKDTLFQQEKSRQITEIQAKYESEKKENEIKFLKQDNDLKDARLNQNRLLIISLGGVLLGGLALGFMYRTRIQLKQSAELEATRAALRESQLQAVIASQEEERKRFAADLHDGLGQMISAVRLGLSKESLDKGIVHHSLTLLNEMNQEIRNIAFNLMPQVLVNGGLEEALKEFASRLMRAGGITIQVQTFDLAKDMPTEQRVALYRISQEWVNNVIKYSSATSISIQVVQHPQELVLTIEDNGQGFNPAKLMQSEGNGWKNINSRLHLIKGELEIDSQEGRMGTTLVITV